MLLQFWVTFTYFAYICSSRGKLWTFLSSLAWKVPNLIHLFVGYLERKQQRLWNAGTHCLQVFPYVSPNTFPEQKYILLFPAARQQQPKSSAGPSHNDGSVQTLEGQNPRLIQSPKCSQSTTKPPQMHREEHNPWQVVLLSAGQRTLSKAELELHNTSALSLTLPCFRHPRRKGVFLMPFECLLTHRAESSGGTALPKPS